MIVIRSLCEVSVVSVCLLKRSGGGDLKGLSSRDGARMERLEWTRVGKVRLMAQSRWGSSVLCCTRTEITRRRTRGCRRE